MGFKTQYFPDDMCMSVMYTMCRYIDLLLVLLCTRVGQCLRKFWFFFLIWKGSCLFLCDNKWGESFMITPRFINWKSQQVDPFYWVYYELLLFHGLASAFIFLIWYSRVKYWCIGLQSGVEQWRSDSLERIAIYVWKYWP